MSCDCNHTIKNPDGFEKRPRTPCIFCAEKHLATAFALANETGYESINRMFIIGELVLAQWHLKEHKDVGLKLRNARHLIQERKEKEINWEELINGVETLVENNLPAT